MKLFLVFISLLALPLYNQGQEASSVINSLTNKMDRINDYSVDVLIKSDIPLIKILPVRATIYFKKKDKFRIISKGIAIIPKQGFTDISKLLEDKSSYNSMLTGLETISGSKTEVVTILPVSDTSDLILAKLWIDNIKNIVLKSQVTTRSNGTVSIDYFHKQENDFGLPDSMVFTVDVRKFKIPKGVATDINRTSANDENMPASKSGKIYIQLSNYKINKGLSDDVFKK